MARFAAKLDERLLDAIERWARKGVPAAEIRRRVGRLAERRGLPRPSYERVRQLVEAERRKPRYPTAAEVLIDVFATRARPPEHLIDLAAGTLPPKRST